MADVSSSPKKRRRRWPYVIGGIVLLLVVLIVLLPTLVTWGLGQGLIRKSIAKNINGDVRFARLKASWVGDQEIEGLRVTYPNGEEAANLNVAVRAGLLQLATQRPGPVDVTISGTIKGEVREDSSLSFSDLIPPRQPSQAPPQPSQKQPFSVADLPPVQVNIAGLDVHLKNLKTQQVLALQKLTGTLAYEEPTQPITLALSGETVADGNKGTISINGLAENVFSPAGTPTLQGASARLDVQAQSVPLPLAIPGVDAPTSIQNATINIISDDLTQRIVATAEVNAQIEGQPPTYAHAQAALGNVLSPRGELSLAGGTANITVIAKNLPIQSADIRGQLQQLRATVVSNDLTKTVVIAVDSNAELQDQAPSVLAASLSVDELLSADGIVAPINEIIERTTGAVQGTTVPTVLVQPLLANTPVDAARDLGPVVDINASFSSGAARDISVVIDGLTRMEMRASVDTDNKSIRGHHLLLSSPQVHPDLVKGLAGVTIDKPADLTVRLSSFVIPPGDPLPRRDIAATGTIAIRGPFNMTLSGDTPPLAVQSAQLHFDSPALGQHVQAEGVATIDDASITFKQKISNLFDADGKLDPINALPEGTLALNNVRSTTLAKFAPQQQPLIEQVIGPAMSATIETSVQNTYLTATTQATAAGLSANATVTRKPDALQIVSAHAALRVTPQLAAALQKESAEPITLGEPASVSINVQPFDLPATAPFAYTLPSDPIQATLESQQIVIQNPPSLVEPVALAGLLADIAVRLTGGDWTASATGDVEIRRPNVDQSLAHARYRGEAFSKDKSLAATATVGITGLSVVNLEQMLGQKSREISQWTGDSGNMNVHVQLTGETQQKITLRPQLPNFHGEFFVTADEQWITITGETHEMKLAQAAVESRMNPKPQDGAPAAAATPEARVQLLNDVPVAMKVKHIRLPRHAAEGFDPAQVVLEADITGGPMRLVSPGEVRTTLDNLHFTIDSKNLAEGVQFALNSTAEATVPAQPAQQPPGTVSEPARDTAKEKRKPGTLEITGTLVDLVNEQSKLNVAGAKLRMNAKATNVPTAVADALANMQGLLTAAVGPMMTATFKAQNFSLESGRVETQIDATNGSLESIILGRQNSLRINTDNPLTAQLEITPPLRERLLFKINPILADIRTTEQPLKASIPWMQAGFKDDGTFDISDLNANIEVTIGKVELDSGSTSLFLLKIVGQGEKRATIPGEFEPIIAKVRKGIVTYDRFAVRIDKYTMVYSGQIDLVKQTMNLRTELPLAALGKSIRELEPYADKIIVPIVTRGKFGEQKTQIDPDFDIGKEALKAGFGGTLDQLLRDKGGLGGLLDQLKPK